MPQKRQLNAVTVTATSVADSNQSASAKVTVQPAGAGPQVVSISVSPVVITPVGGKVPTSAVVSVSVDSCNGDSNIGLATAGYTVNASPITVVISPICHRGEDRAIHRSGYG
jgi:hypothetical protein